MSWGCVRGKTGNKPQVVVILFKAKQNWIARYKNNLCMRKKAIQ